MYYPFLVPEALPVPLAFNISMGCADILGGLVDPLAYYPGMRLLDGTFREAWTENGCQISLANAIWSASPFRSSSAVCIVHAWPSEMKPLLAIDQSYFWGGLSPY
jgi:hypothetical protein